MQPSAAPSALKQLTLPVTRPDGIVLRPFNGSEEEVQCIVRAMARDLSEPYSIFTYRYFVHNWPDQCICGFVNVPTADGAGTRLKLPALVASPRRLILPAFSPWAAGTTWNNDALPEEILWAIAPSRIFAVKPQRLGFARGPR